MSRATYDLLDEPTGQTYSRLLQTAGQVCSEFHLVLKPSPASLGVDSVLARLRPYLLRQVEASEWPGNQAVGWTAQIYRYRLTLESREVLEHSAPGLYAWVQRSLPEDPAFFRADGSLWLATITHERDAFFELSPDEHRSLRHALPEIRLRRRYLQH